jgi:uroporphyrinogen III methyltransferase/synthase
VAAPTYAGVPVTYPGAGDTLTFVRGHEDGSNRALRVDWTTLAKLGGTVVCYAGPRQLPGIVDAILSHGRAEDDWAALVVHGTMPQQDTFHGTLGEIRARLKKDNGPRLPAILVVGAVAGLREHLRWFDARPLFGRRVLVTRSREQAAELVEMLEDLGAETIEVPSVTITPPPDFGPLDAACSAAGSYDWVVFTSGYAVESFLRRLQVGSVDVRSLAGPRLCAIGPVTIERLLRTGLKAEVRMVEYRPEHIIEAMRGFGSLSDSRVLFFRSDSPREVLSDELAKAGAIVESVTAYCAVADPYNEADQDIYKKLLDGQVDISIFTSASSVRNFAQRIGQEQAADLLRSTVVACIGPVTAEAAERLGIHATVVPSEYTLSALVRAVVQHFKNASIAAPSS